MMYNKIKNKIISFLACKCNENRSPDTDGIKWLKIAECNGDISMSKFVLFIKNKDFNFACDLAIVITEELNCIGISSDTVLVAFDPKTEDLFIGFKYDKLPDDLNFSYESDRSVNIKYLDKLIPIDKLPEGSMISEINK